MYTQFTVVLQINNG